MKNLIYILAALLLTGCTIKYKKTEGTVCTGEQFTSNATILRHGGKDSWKLRINNKFPMIEAVGIENCAFLEVQAGLKDGESTFINQRGCFPNAEQHERDTTLGNFLFKLTRKYNTLIIESIEGTNLTTEIKVKHNGHAFFQLNKGKFTTVLKHQ